MTATSMNQKNQSTRPRFEPTFNVECAQLILNQGYSVCEAAQAMGVGHSTIDRWARKLKQGREGRVIQGKPISEDPRKIAELEKRIKRLELGKEILKKASALLMSDSMNGLR